MALAWLHVSDFHLSDKGSYNQEVILRSLVESVKRLRGEGHVPDLIFATGDIASRGNAKEYEFATKFFDDLLDAAGLNRDRLFIIPGNHDVDRKTGKFLARTLDTKDDADEYFGTETPLPHLTLKFHAFSEWYDSYFNTIRSFPTNTTCSPVEILTINGMRLAVLPLNSALFCIGKDDHQKLFIGRRCLDAAKKQLAAVDLTIALIHHPLDWLCQVERANIKAALGESVDLLLHGHYHETETESIASANGGYLKLAAGASYQTREWPNSAMYATFENNQVTIFPIRYEDSPREVWALDTSLYPSPAYTRSFSIPGRADAGLPPAAVFGNTASRKKNLEPTSSPLSSLVRIVKILVASPGDVAEERKMAVEVILDWNARHPNSRIRLEAVLWERYAAPENRGDGKGPQEPINRQLVDECDFAIGIFWTRIGTPTKNAPGGAVEEVQRMLASQKPVMLYFSNVAYRRNEIELDQIAKLDAFRTAMRGDGLVWEYEERHEFESKLSHHLELRLPEWYPDGLVDSMGAGSVLPVIKSYECYREALRSKFRMVAARGLDNYQDIEIPLEDVFIDLHISEQYGKVDAHDNGHTAETKKMSQDALLQEIFHGNARTNVLLLIGDPGSGKTTLLQHYAMLCLEGGHERLFPEATSVRVVFIELRKLNFDAHNKPVRLAAQIVELNRPLSLAVDEVETWWREMGETERVLVLLDGLDEVTELEKRKAICQWIDEEGHAYPNRFFIVTTRSTGYVTSDGVELNQSHRRAVLDDLEPGQQWDFLLKWFRAASKFEKERGFTIHDVTSPDDKARELYAYLYPEKYDKSEEKSNEETEKKKKGLQQIAGIPLLLKLMALLYKLRDFKPNSRIALYRVVILYLLHGRDNARQISYGIDPEQSTTVLGLLAYTMQKENCLDLSKREMKKIIESRFQSLNTTVELDTFFDFMVKRSGILKTNGNAFRFWHKTFQEYLASWEMVRCSKSDAFVRSIVQHYDDRKWEWDETLRFYFAQIDADIFDSFMNELFNQEITTDVLQRKLLLMKTLIRESREHSTGALCLKLSDTQLSLEVQWYILDCLEAINMSDALDAVRAFHERAKQVKVPDDKLKQRVLDKAAGLINQLERTAGIKRDLPPKEEKEKTKHDRQPEQLPRIISNTSEGDAQYILIPKGSYLESKTKEQKDVEKDLYFAKYPVTNKRYRSFIAALPNSSELRDKLSEIAHFNRWDTEFAKYLKKGQNDFATLFRSTYDEDRKFGGDDQPVVGVSWYAAQAYALWLSQLEGKPDYSYRLPKEVEWEWAAGGRQGEAVQEVRKYPWPNDKEEPNSKLLNYDSNVGATTPVGSYPQGATPEGLYDMAGNVWEWTDSWWDEKTRSYRVLRGGSWFNGAEFCRSASRFGDTPGDRGNGIGFRLVFVP
jgi:formylglycine-generating enzyme required for sulfatase activity/predicted MPP superfamily phosphohydrolase/energy-coupling factor transporter ATP-binding protein EcfA2